MKIEFSRITDFISSPLIEPIRRYFQKNESEKIYIFSPYIKTKYLEKLVEGITNEIIIITTWDTNDLISGSSDIELYNWCKNNGNHLYIHDDIHLKVYSINLESAIVGSGNISHNGLMPGGSYEAAVFVELTKEDRIYLEKIKSEAIFVDDEIYQQYLENYEECKKKAVKQEPFPQPEIKSKEELFLRSALPMTDSMEQVVQGYLKIQSNLALSEDKIIEKCIFHDITNYKIPKDLSEQEIREKLKKQFLAHPFTKTVMDEIDNHERKHFGMIQNWIHEHCTEVPLPRRWEFKTNTKILMDWLVESGDYRKFKYGEHTESIERINPISNLQSPNSNEYENKVLEILNESGKTIDEIKIIYKQDPRLRMHDEPSDSNEIDNSSKQIWHFKAEMDQKIIDAFSLSEEEVGARNSRGSLYKKIATIMGKLNEENLIKMWYFEQVGTNYFSDGIWRLTEKGKQEIQRRGISNIIESHKENKLENSRLVLFSVSGDASFEHFESTILKDVETFNFPTSDMKKLPKVRMWGAIDRSTNNNRSKWSKLKKGDILLFYKDKKYVAQMIISGTEDNYDVAKMIWGEKIDHETMNVESKSGETWQLIMYAEPENVKQIDIKMEDLNNLLGYKENFMPTRTLDFTSVNDLKLQQLQNQYGSIQNALDTINF